MLGALVLQQRRAASTGSRDDGRQQSYPRIARLEAARLRPTSICGDLEKSLRRPRSLFNFIAELRRPRLLTLLALVPLFSVVYMLVVTACHSSAWRCSLAAARRHWKQGGGFGNAILGTLIMVGIAALMSVPLGIVAAVFLAEVGPGDQAGLGRPLRGQGAQRLSLDSGRRVRLRGRGAGDRRLFGAGRRRGAGAADAAHGDSHGRRGDPHGARPRSARRRSAWGPPPRRSSGTSCCPPPCPASLPG